MEYFRDCDRLRGDTLQLELDADGGSHDSDYSRIKSERRKLQAAPVGLSRKVLEMDLSIFIFNSIPSDLFKVHLEHFQFNLHIFVRPSKHPNI